MNYAQTQQQAYECFQNYLYSDSINFFERCIEINSTELSNYWYLGLASLLIGEELFTETVWMSVFAEASEAEADIWSTDLITLTEQLAIKSFRAKRFEDAETLYLKIREITPEFINAYLGLGRIYIENGKYQEAIKVLQQSIILKPDFASSYHDLGFCFRQLEQYQEAITNFKQAIALQSDYVSAFYFLGICFGATKDYVQEISNFQTVLNLDANHLNAHICLAGCLLKTHNLQNINAAIKWLEKARKIDPNSAMVLSGLAACWIALGKLPKAQSILYQALKLDPKLSVIYYNLGVCFRNLGQYDQAIVHFRKAIELDPDWSNAKRFVIKLEESITYCPKIKQGYNVWDAMLFKDEDCYRLLYLQGDSKAFPSWIVGEMAMAVSKDLKNWQYQNMVLEPNPDSNWEDGRILAGSLYKENNIYYLFYSVASSQDLLEERIGLATSEDCITWNRRENPLLEQDKQFYGSYSSLFEKSAKQTPLRDPYVVKDPESGKYYMFFTTSFREGNFPYKGCIGLAVADHIDGNYQLLPPVALPLLEGTKESIFVEMERPQIIYRNGKYNLFCSTNIMNTNLKWLRKVGKDKITNSSLYWYISDKITGPFKPSSEIPVVKGSEQTGLYGINIIEAPDGSLFAAGNDILSRTLEVSPHYAVIWEDKHLEILID